MGNNNYMVKNLSKDIEDFPNLKKELEKKNKVLPLKYVDEDKAQQIEEEIEEETKEKKPLVDPYRFVGYNPTVIDFIRRCETEKDAKEIIDFLKKKGDLTKEDSVKLLKQLESEGLRSFGEKKQAGFYSKNNE